MEFLIDTWDAIKSYLWEGDIDSLTVFSDADGYSTALDLAADLRSSIEVPVSAKVAESVSIGDDVVDVDAGTWVILTKMTPSLFKGGYFTMYALKKS